MDVALVWFARILFLATFPLAIAMLMRAWKLGVRQDFRYVATWNGSPLPDPKRWAPAFLAVNLVGGGVLVGIVLAVIFIGVEFQTWAGGVGLVLWIYHFIQQMCARKARLIEARKETEAQQASSPG